MAHAHVALELLHRALVEHVAHQALSLVDEQLAVLDGRDARGVLAAMLQHRQCVIDALVDSTGTDDACDSAHAWGGP
jgi:hypothetical protein